MKKEVISILKNFSKTLNEFDVNNSNTIPLCAAEPIISDFVKKPLISNLSERYIKSGISTFDPSSEFIGSEYLYPIYQLISEVCMELFNAEYADARPLSGMNAALTTLMSVTSPNDRVLLLHPDAGAHESYPAICERLSLDVTYIPFDYENISYKIEAMNQLLECNEFSAIIIPPSDLIFAPPFELMNIPLNTTIVYDCTQSFGLIAAKLHSNPLTLTNNVILLGGTHKTIAGPTCGLVLANNKIIYKDLEKNITPIYVRNPHPHHIASLLMALVEFMESGSEFMIEIIKNANLLGSMLEERGFTVKKIRDDNPKIFTQTHQLFMSLTTGEAITIERAARMLNISLDKKDKKMYGEAGIRLGVQAVTRLGWKKKEFEMFSDLILDIKNGVDLALIAVKAEKLRGKASILYTLDSNEHEFLNTLDVQLPN